MKNPPCILLVDDEKDIVEILEEILRPIGATFITANNGVAGLELYTRHTPQLVISDVRMPGLDGLEMLTSIRELGSDVPVIFVTAFGDRDTMVKGWLLGAHDFLEKPFDEPLIHSTVLNALAFPRAPRLDEKFGSVKDKAFQKLSLQIPKTQFSSLQKHCLAQGISITTYLGCFIERELADGKSIPLPVKKVA